MVHYKITRNDYGDEEGNRKLIIKSDTRTITVVKDRDGDVKLDVKHSGMKHDINLSMDKDCFSDFINALIDVRKAR